MHPQNTSAMALPPVLDFQPSCTDGIPSCCGVSGESGSCSLKPLEAPQEASSPEVDLLGIPSSSKPSARLRELSEWFSGRIVGEADSSPEHKGEGEEAAELSSSIYTGAQVVQKSQSLVGQVVSVKDRAESKGYVVPEEVLVRLDDLQTRRAWTSVVADEFVRRGDTECAERLRCCGSDAWFRRWVETGTVDLIRVDWCNKRIVCANCEKARTARTLANWVPKIRETLKLNAEYVPCLITLTVKDGEHILERIQHISDALGRLRKKKKNANRGTGVVGQFQMIEGAVWHLEVKRGRNSGLWHPHFHGICLRHRDTPFDLSAMRAEWNKATGGDSWNIDVQLTTFAREMISSGLDAGAVDELHPELLMGDLCEVLKYVTKPGESPVDMVDVYKAVYGKRLVRTWGLLYGLTPQEADNDAITNYGAYVDFVYRFDRDNKPSLSAIREGVMSPDALSHAEVRPRYVDCRWPCTSCGTFEGVDFAHRPDGPPRYLCKSCAKT